MLWHLEFMPDDPKRNPVDPVLARLLEDGLAIQDRFVPEPMLKATGKGYLKSRGVEGLKQDMEELRRTPAARAS